MFQPQSPIRGLAAAMACAALMSAVALAFVLPRGSADEAVRGRLQSRGRTLVYADGTPFRWRGVTAFRLVDYVARGREDRARAFLAWARGEGFSVVRVLAMASVLFELTPQDGRRALPRLLLLAAEHDLHVEVVALADTRTYPGQDLAAQVHAVGAICAAAANCVLELANEPYHGTQVNGLTADRLATLARGIPAILPVAFGAASSDSSREMARPPATYVTVHRERSRDPWQSLIRVRDLAALSASTGMFVVDDEPDGFGDRERVNRAAGPPYRRQVRPEIAFGQGVMARLFDVGSTWHCESCLLADVPGPVQRAAASAFIAGTRVVGDAPLSARDAGQPGSPVAGVRSRTGNAPAGSAAGVFTGLSGETSGVVVLVGVQGDPELVWAPGWRAGEVLGEWPGLRVVRALR